MLLTIEFSNELLEDSNIINNHVKDRLEGKSFSKLTKLQELENRLQEYQEKIDYYVYWKSEVEEEIRIEKDKLC